MLKARLRQPCLQIQPGCPTPGKAAQNPCVCGTAKGDTEGDASCWQERGSRGGQRCRQLRDAPASEAVEQEGWTGPPGGKVSGSCRREPRGLNGDTPGPSVDNGSLALATEPAAPTKCPGSAPELRHAAASPTADPSQEWKVVKIQRVLINPAGEPRKAGLSRSASLSEKELKEAKARSRRIAAQLTTAPSPSSKGVLLFNRRKQRVDGLAGAGHGGGLPLTPAPRPRQAAMEEGEGQGTKPEPDQPGTLGEGLQANTSPCRETPAEAQQVPLSIYLKENMASAATNGVQEGMASRMESRAGGLGVAGAPAGLSTTAALALPQSPKEGKNGEVPGEVPSKVPSAPVGTATGTASPASQRQNGVQGRQYYEVHLTLAKPKPVKNRTARPFGTQSSPASGQPADGPPATELPPPPTYAETLSSPPPLTRVRSPPAYSALYPPREQKMLPGPPLSCGASGPNPLPKTGILEESAARRGGKKSMFTFVEKPKLGPNPDLLDLVQSADSRKKQKEQGEPGAEDEPFALGAEASNFVPNSMARGGQHLLPADDAPAWSSCLKSPTIKPKPKPQPTHNLSEARGKGAELFARRQSRMEKFIIEAPSQPELLRSPSPTMSLPPSWRYDANACLSPMVSRHPSKSPSRPSKTPPASLYGGNLMENEVSQKELEISKHQPYQLQSSLFILSPSKGPARSMPREMPPPRPSLPDAYPYSQQTSCPTSPLPPSPVWHPPAVPGAGQTTSSPLPGATGALPLTHDSRAGPGAPNEVLLASPCRLLPPRAKGGFQAPRPSYSTRNAGIEPQERRPSLPASPTWTPRPVRRPGSLDGWASPASVPELDEGPPTSPPWSERSLSPLRQDADPRASRQMQARLARNIINAARRKSSSPKAVGPEGSRPFTPIPAGPPSLPQSPRPESSRAPALQAAGSVPGSLGSPSPTHKSPLRSPRADGPQFCASPGMPRASWAEGRRLLLSPSVSSCPIPGLSPSPKSPLPSPVVGGRSSAKRCTSRSPTDSDVSLDSEDSGAKSPGIHSFNLCPRGWTSSLRLKQGGLPSGAPCTS
ncbi:PREDICTED: synaptopodin [Haliaeetus leucocephalus]|uniref:synaptopodin n=1 Tax=Haliaeetus leucocephalus TaxID=52644 RepID=UPI00053CD95E|nr:PREDICTED: synaptopodin [Haliaeetus leucocephalus]